MKHLHTFPKSEHLCLRRHTDALFGAGSRVLTAYPVRLVYRKVEREAAVPPAMVMLSVAKRRLHHAVDRNRAKRQLREAYRLNKHVLLDGLGDDGAVHLALIWMAATPMPTSVVMRRVENLLQRLGEKFVRTRQQAMQADTDEPGA